MRALAAIGLSLLVASCAAQRSGAAPAEAAEALLRQGPSHAALREAAVEARRPRPLHVKEQGLGDLALGADEERVRRVFGAPDRTEAAAEGVWWFYRAREERLRRGRIEVLFAGEPPTVSQIRAWAPSQLETRTMVRPLDPAERLTRKYGAPDATLPWGAGEAWLFPAANVAYVLTPAGDEGHRLVAGVIVGL